MRIRPLAPARILLERMLLAWLCVVAVFRTSRKETLVWGPTPIINNKHWSNAMTRAGRRSTTLMQNFYPNNQREDFDLYFEDLVPRWIPTSTIRGLIEPFVATRWVMRHASVTHISFTGGALGQTRFWKREEWLLRSSGVKIVVIPYGGDVYRYSRIGDPALRHALLRDYPLAARRERAIQDRVDYWVERADVIMAGFDVDGLGRWDIPPHNMCAIDASGRAGRNLESTADGTAGTVVVAHAPNHRGFKGTEFVIQAVDELKDEGLAVELMLLERVPNDEVQRRFREEAHILLDQLITVGYGFAALEGMAAGLPVVANLDDDRLLRVFRAHSFFNECPLVSGTPESIKDVLRELVRRPELRAELGRAGQQYVERFHSYEASARVFGAIHANLLENGSFDLMRAFDPIVGVHPVQEPIAHPLVRNQIVFDE